MLLQPGRIGPVEVRNRFVRAGTSEGMVDSRSAVTEQLVNLYRELARGGVGLIVTGHMFVDARGRYDVDQSALDSDDMIAPLSRAVDAAHHHGSKVFAQIAHAGSQSIVPACEPLAPSAVPNVMTKRAPREASNDEIEACIDQFAAAARRAVAAGCDGVHIHGANGYLISQFSSPITNRRDDRWGGDAERRGAFLRDIVQAVRSVVPASHAVTAKLGLADMVDGGMDLAEGVARARTAVANGLDGVEVSGNLMGSYTNNIVPYVAVNRRRAFADLLFHRVVAGEAAPEAYYRAWSRALRDEVDTSVVLVGGLRTVETMADVISSGDADFVALSRPLIREPSLVHQISQGRTGLVDCTSCNICLMHSGHHPLRCWRTPRRRLLEHAVHRLRGTLR